MTADEIIEATLQLSFKEQLRVIESILQSLEPHREKLDPLWFIEVRRQLDEIRSGAAGTIPGD